MKVIMASGISGGHLFPAIAVADEMRKKDKDCRILLVTGRKELAERILNNEKFPFVLLPAFPKLKGRNLLLFAFRFFQDFALSFRLLRKERPDAVVGFGGTLTGPVLLCAWLCGISTVIHEQNVVPGRTNRVLARFAGRIALSFENTKELFGRKRKSVFTGNPIRGSLRIVNKDDAAANFGFKPDNFTLFVMGGSQGAHSLNRAVTGIIEKFRRDLREKLQIVHITGETDYKMVQDKYRRLNVKSRVYAFMEEIDSAYSASDLVISRAGASAIYEINFLGKPTILIPYPFAKAHQVENARFIAERNMAVLVEDNEELPDRLHGKIMDFYNSRKLMRRFSDTQKLQPDAAKNMVNLILEAAR